MFPVTTNKPEMGSSRARPPLLLSLLFVAVSIALVLPPLSARLDASTLKREDNNGETDPVRWPGVFATQMLTNRSNHFTLDRLWYDWDFNAGVGRQLIRIAKEDGTFLYDLMPGDGNVYYFHPHEGKCTSLKFGVSILNPEWQKGGEFMGDANVDGIPCFQWRKGFGIQCTSYASREPLLVTFDHHFDKLDPARDNPAWTSRYLTFEPGEKAPEELYRVPDYCPPPHALSDDKMAEIRRQLTADPENPPHFLLDDDNLPLKEQQQQQGSGGSYQKAHGGGGDDATSTMLMMDGDGLELPPGHPNTDFFLMRRHHCPYLNSLAASSSPSATDAAASAAV